MFQGKMSQGKSRRWVASVLERSGDIVALGGGMIGVALIVAVILVGLHERQTPLRAMAPVERGEIAPR